MWEIDGHVGHALANDIQDDIASVGGEVIVPVEHARCSENAEVLRALRQQAVEEHFIEAFRTAQRFGDALDRVLIEVEACRTERQIEIRNDDVGFKEFRNTP